MARLACRRGGGRLLYLAVRVSPLGYKPTTSITLLVMAAAGMGLYAVSGQALGPARYIVAVIRWRFGPAQYRAPDTDRPVSGGVLVDAVPLALADVSGEPPWWRPEDALLVTNANASTASDAGSESAS